MKNLRQRIVAFFAGFILGPAAVWAGLETGTFISDLVATNPLGSDLASTLDDHIRLLKSTIKTTFPSINGAVSSTDEELSLLAGKSGTVWTSANDGAASTLDADLLDGLSSGSFCQSGGGASCPGGLTGVANPTASVGLSAVNGSATTFLRSDGAPALSQAIAPTWTGTHTFSRSYGGTGQFSSIFSANVPTLQMFEADASSNNKSWVSIASAEQYAFQIWSDNEVTANNVMTVDRTGTTVDRVAFPAEASGGFVVGTLGTILNSTRMQVRTTTASASALQLENTTATAHTLLINNTASSGDNAFVYFATDSSGTGTQRGSITYNRAGGVVAYNTTSDERLKKNFKNSPSARSLIDCIKVESYDWKQTGYHVDHGLVAQRLYKCAPYAVSGSMEPDKIWGVDPSKLVPALIKYVQEQDSRIARLEADAARRH